MTKFKIILKGKESKRIRFEEVEGYPLPHGLFVYERDGKWTICDVNTGTSVKDGLSKRSDVKKVMEDEPFMNALLLARKSTHYKKLCDKFNEGLKEEQELVDLWN